MKKIACLFVLALTLAINASVFAAQPVAGKVLNTNPTFDEGISGWEKNGGGGTTLSSDTGGRDGSNCLKVNVTNNTSSYDSASPKQTITFQTGKTYTVSVWIKYPATADGGSYTFNHALRMDMGANNTLKISYQDGSTAEGRYPYLIKTAAVSGTEWVKLEQTFTVDKITTGGTEASSAAKAVYINREKGGDYDSGRVSFWVDDFYIIEHQDTQYFDVTIATEGNGKVLADGQAIANGGTVPVAGGESKSFTLQPDEGWKIGAVSAGGQALTPDSNGIVTIDNISEALTLSVTFTEKTVQEPAFSGAPQLFEGIHTPDGGIPCYCSTVFSAINPGYGWDIVTYGMEIFEKGAVVSLPLEAEICGTDGKYGIRVYGPALENGKTYVMQPYMVIKSKADQSVKTVRGPEKEFTVS